MKTFRDLIDEYLKSSDTHTMEALTYKMDAFIEDVRKHHPELVERFLCVVDMTLNPHFTEETAKYAVSLMKNRDGSSGEKWSLEETSRVLRSKGYNFNVYDWYYTINMKYSDEYEQGKSSEEYIKDAYFFLDDIDAPEDKAKRYFLAMHE